ncbi:hypothetical protein HID58_003988 [Brassica napus]|uniref:Uncharacterized protein n=1 Tax=Brassica napus TaxID=3708 RepID=A0ABQ7XI71_BRANA|nr:hypothetical protein HID58_094516 [Brassica napus]KAH0855664.1 hypothetical protein HID58_003988 [Brassica napus]
MDGSGVRPAREHPSGPDLVRRRHLEECYDIIGGAAGGVEASRAPLPPALFPGGGGFLSSAFAGFSFRGVKVFFALRRRLSGLPSSVLAFFLVVVINGSGGDLACAIDLSDDRISGLKAVAVTMIWSCRARVCTGGSIDGCFTGGLARCGGLVVVRDGGSRERR